MDSDYKKNAAEVLYRCGRHCCICRRFRPTMLQVHHIVERTNKGGDELDNLIPVCLTCHSDVHTKRPFGQRFSEAEQKRHRDRVYDMVAKGVLVPPNDDELPVSAAPPSPPVAAGSLEAFVITAEGLVQPRLPSESVELLLAAANSRNGQVIAVRVTGGFGVHVEDKNFVSSRNPRDEARYKHAVEQLERHGFLAGPSKALSVTHQGYLLADALEAAGQK